MHKYLFFGLFIVPGLLFSQEVPSSISLNAIECLAKNIYHESRGQPTKGMVGVGSVTVNRTQHPAFPADVCDVVYQKSQFSWTLIKNKKILEPKEWSKSVMIAYRILAGLEEDPTKGSLYFNNIPPNSNVRIKAKIGGHIFY